MINGSIKTCSIPYGSTMDVTVPMPGNDTYLCNVIIFNEYGSQDNWENFQLEAGSTHLVNINGITLSTLDSFGIMNTGSFF
jgi:hypothetical protein